MKLDLDALLVDAARFPPTVETGIFVRAVFLDRWISADIAALTSSSLLTWLRSDGGDNPLAEGVVMALLGHRGLTP